MSFRYCIYCYYTKQNYNNNNNINFVIFSCLCTAYIMRKQTWQQLHNVELPQKKYPVSCQFYNDNLFQILNNFLPTLSFARINFNATSIRLISMLMCRKVYQTITYSIQLNLLLSLYTIYKCLTIIYIQLDSDDFTSIHNSVDLLSFIVLA